MMRFFILTCLFVSFVWASDHLSFGNNKRVYTIQLFSTSKKLSQQALVNTVPKELRDELHLHHVKNDTVACYSQATDYKTIQKKLKKVRRAGYKKAYIITTTRWYMSQKEKSFHKPKLSKYIISQMIAKANNAYKNSNEYKAMMYYEMLLAAGVKSEKIKNNLCYIYGKNGAWAEAKDLIDHERYPAKLIYAYANGAATTLQDGFYTDLKEYIILDRSGHLALLAGYYFEQKALNQRALEFYKMAYKKNRNDIYNIYGYARFLDIIGQKSDALRFYLELYEKSNEESPIHKALASRLHK